MSPLSHPLLLPHIVTIFPLITGSCDRGELSGIPNNSPSTALTPGPINATALIFLTVTCVAFCFPPAIPVASGTAMNWVVVVVALVWLLCGITWVVDGRNTFRGPTALHERLAIAKAA